ncbi:hypothetical protein [Corynebacterium variabile]|uniref:hypothetical protein n=1 Tax=Corynebacterium variabile TaxID=1727 RepID=UPI0028E9C609|nr:hypothetical protein [Corynebacterium variabile]
MECVAHFLLGEAGWEGAGGQVLAGGEGWRELVGQWPVNLVAEFSFGVGPPGAGNEVHAVAVEPAAPGG